MRRFGVQRRSKSGKNISLKISVNSLLSSILYIYDRPRLPFCKLGCRITKYVQWNILIITLYYKTHLLRTTLSWNFMISCVIVFYLITFLSWNFTISCDRLLFLKHQCKDVFIFMISPRIMLENIKVGREMKNQLIRIFPFVNFVTTQYWTQHQWYSKWGYQGKL